MGGVVKLSRDTKLARRRRFFLRLYAYKTRFSFAKTMVLERFRNVVQAILNTEITKISGLRPDSSQNPFSIASIIN